MRYSFWFFTLVGWLIYSGCTNPGGDEQQSQRFSVEMVRYENESPGCIDPEQGCIRIDLSYPQVRGTKDDISYRINATIQTEVMSQIGWSVEEEGAASALDIEAMAQNLINEYEALRKDHPETTQDWEINIEAETLLESAETLSILLKTYRYTGGAHPSTYYVLNSFDLENGQSLAMADLVADTAAVRSLTEQHFRMARGLSPETDLREEGFFFERDIPLPTEYALTGEGLMVIYNSYEIGPYVMGPTEFTIPRQEIDAYLQKRYQ